jgi:hypothetical protein
MAIKIVSPVENLVVNGTGGTLLDVQGSAGQLFSVTDSLTGDLFAVSDISGIPILNVNSSGAVDIDGTLAVDGNLSLGDSDKIQLGASQDLQIYHDGSHSYIRDQGSGNLIITGSQLTFSNVADTEYMAKMVQDGTVELYYNGSKKLETTNTGVTVTGNIGATNFSGSSSGTNTGDQTLPTLSSLGALSASGTAFSLSGTDVTVGESITLAGGLSYSGTTLTSANDNTTYTAGTGLTLTGTAFSVTANTYATAAQGTTADAALPKAGGTMTGQLVTGGGGLGIKRNSTNGTIWFNSGTDANHALWNAYYGESPTTRGSANTGFDGMFWNTLRGLKIRGGSSGAYNLIVAENSTGSTNDHTVKLYASNVLRLQTTTTGVTVTGNIGATNFSGSSSGTNTGDQDLSGYLLNTTDTFAGNLTFNGGNNTSKESFLNVKRGSGAGLWLKFQTDSTSANDVSQFVIRRSTDNVDILSITATSGNLSVPGTLAASNLSGTNTGDQTLPTLSSLGAAPLASPALTGTPTAPTAGSTVNTTQLATTAFVQTAIANLSDSAPATLNTLNELAAALGDDASFSTTVATSIGTKLPLAGGTMTGNLTITQSSGNNTLTLNSSGGGAPVIYMNSPTRNWGQFVSASNLRFKDETGNIDVLTLEAGGNVGIGTTSPSSTLTVNGELEILKDDISSSAEGGHITLRAGSSSALSYRFNIDNYSDKLRIFRQDDSTASNGVVFMQLSAQGNLQLNQYGAGILKTDASGNVSLDTNTYSTASGVANNADVTPSWVPATDPSYLTTETFGATDVAFTVDGNDVIAGDDLVLAGGLTWTNSTKTLTSANDNTTYTAGTGLTLSGTQFSVTANTYAAKTHNHSGLYIEGIDFARRLGWVPAYGNSTEDNVSYDFQEEAIKIKHPTDTSVGGAYKAIRVKSGDKVRFSVMAKASTTISSGFYLRLYQVDGDLPNGKTHVSHGASNSHPFVEEDDRADISWVENAGLTNAWTNYEHTYTAAADGYVSLVVLNWDGAGANVIYVQQPDIQFEKVNDASKLGGVAASSYITSQRAISSTPTDGATTTAISSDWAFDNVKTAVPASAVFTDTVYTHPASAGNKHVPTGGAAGQFLKYSSSGTAVWATPSYTTNTNTTYTAGTGLTLTGTSFSVTANTYATAAQGTTADAALPKAGGTMTGALAGTTATFSGQAHFKDTGNSSGGSILMGPTGSGVNKWSYLAGTHYNQDTGSGNGSGSAGVAVIGCLSTSTYNKVLIGGNPYEINPATQIEFWTHTATTHTTGGSVKMKIAGDGALTLSAYGAGILKTNASGVVSLDTNTYLTAETFSSSDVVMSLSGTDVTAGESITLAGGLSYSGTTLTSANDNTTYTAGTGLTLTGTSFSLTGSYLPLSGGTLTGALTGSTATFSIVDTLAVIIDEALIKNENNTDVDTGTETIAQVQKGTYTAVFFDFVIKNGTNVRAGTVYSCHDGTNVEFTETSTVDLGDTSDVSLAVDISGTNMRLRATTTSDNWSVKSLVRAI